METFLVAGILLTSGAALVSLVAFYLAATRLLPFFFHVVAEGKADQLVRRLTPPQPEKSVKRSRIKPPDGWWEDETVPASLRDESTLGGSRVWPTDPRARIAAVRQANVEATRGDFDD